MSSGVYFIQGVELKRFKIGWSINIRNRLKQLQTGSAEVLSIYDYFSTDDQGMEGVIQKFFKNFRVRGEWFDVSTTMVDKFMNAYHKLFLSNKNTLTTHVFSTFKKFLITNVATDEIDYTFDVSDFIIDHERNGKNELVVTVYAHYLEGIVKDMRKMVDMIKVLQNAPKQIINVTMNAPVDKCSVCKNNMNTTDPNVMIDSTDSTELADESNESDEGSDEDIDVITAFVTKIQRTKPRWYKSGKWVTSDEIQLRIIEMTGHSIDKAQLGIKLMNLLFSERKRKIVKKRKVTMYKLI